MVKRGNKRNGRPRARTTGGNSYTGERTHVIQGQQIYTTVQNGANGTKLFNTVNAVAVSPDSMGTSIAAIANRFNQYKFTKLQFIFKPSLYNVTTEGPTGSQSNNLFAFGYESDGEVTFTVTHATISALQHAIIVPACGFRSDSQNTLRVRPKDQWYYTEDVTTDSATIRFTIQGILYGEALTTIVTSTVYGEIWVKYTLHLRDMCSDQGVTLGSLVREARLGRTTELQTVVHCLEALAGKKPDLLSNEEFRATVGRHRTIGEYTNMLVNGGVFQGGKADDDESMHKGDLQRQPSTLDVLLQLKRLLREPVDAPP